MTEQLEPPLVALLSDFGYRDHYVGVMKGKILRHCPSARLVDITHGVAPQSIGHGSVCLEQSIDHFPKGTVFLCVVDPGVGSNRKAVAVQSGDFFFVAPDNGLLQRTLKRLGKEYRAVSLPLPEDSSHTFHGRDVFAPAAGRLAAGTPLEQLGEPHASLLDHFVPDPKLNGGILEITVLSIDHFGNVAFECREFPFPEEGRYRVNDADVPFCRTFSDVATGESLLLWNSSGYLELAVRNGSAQSMWGFAEGEEVLISRQEV